MKRSRFTEEQIIYGLKLTYENAEGWWATIESQQSLYEGAETPIQLNPAPIETFVLVLTNNRQ